MNEFVLKHKYFFLLLLLVLFLIPYTIYTKFLKNYHPPTTQKTSQTRSVTPPPPKTLSDSPVPFSNTALTPAPTDADPQNRLLDHIQHRRPLSESDLIAKKKLIALLPTEDHSGDLMHSDYVNIDYTEAVDLFQVEILTPDIDDAKQQAVDYFEENGISSQGICDLPVSFYLNFDVKKAMPTSTPFDPLPPGC